MKHPSEAVKVDEVIQVRVLGFSKRKRRIDLSRKALLQSPESELELSSADLVDDEEEEEVTLPTAMEIALRRAMDNGDDARAKKKKSDAAARSQRKREQQDDILSRTLKLNQDSSE